MNAVEQRYNTQKRIYQTILFTGILVFFILLTATCSTAQNQSNMNTNSEYTSVYSKYFEHGVIRIGDIILPIEVARKPENRRLGLMYRPSIPENFGMLFIFESTQPLSFWMKNTEVPLDIGYFDASRTLYDIHQMEPFDESSVRASKWGIYALEVNQGWFERHGIEVGTRFEWVQHPDDDTPQPHQASN